MRKIAIAIISLCVFLFQPAVAGDTTVFSQLTTDILDNTPVDDVAGTSTDSPTVYYFTQVNGCKGCELVHEWSHDGELIHRYRTTVLAQNQFWWSKNPGVDTGNWTVRTYLNGNVVQVHNYNLSFDRDTAQFAAPFDYEMDKRIISECERNLRQFSQLAADNPDDPYYTFMLSKWQERCVKVQ